MAAFSLNSFAGSIPRLEPHLLPAGAATLALDCKLDSGALSSWREPLLVHNVQPSARTVLRIGDCWQEYSKPIEVAYGPVTCEEVFVTGWYDYPVAISATGPDCVPYTRRLGVPCGGAAPLVIPGAENGAAEKDIESRAYAYQYVDAQGNRGALSRASEPLLVKDGQTVAVSNWDVPDASWGVATVRIYRTVSGVGSSMPTLANTMQNSMDTSWMLVGEVAIGAGVFSDTLRNELLDTAVEEDVVLPPPAGLRGITHIASMNCLAGYTGSRLWFSEDHHYHNWQHYLDLDDNICAITESNGIVYVATDGHPYAVTALADCQSAACRRAVRLPLSYPMVGCGNRAMTALPQGAVYPSHRGLVALSGTSPPSLVTTSLYSPEDWQAIVPQSVLTTLYGGKLFVFGTGGAFAMRLQGNGEDGWQLDSHTELSDRVDFAFTSRQGDMFIVKDSGVWQWDSGATLRPHLWQSQEFVARTEINFGAGHVRVTGGPEYLDLTFDGRNALTRSVLTSRQFRIPNWAVGTRWTVAFRGTGTVVLASFATSMKELTA